MIAKISLQNILEDKDLDKCDLHLHTIYSDGKNTPEEMVIKAISKNMQVIGISDHSYVDFDKDYCMSEEKSNSYRKEINHLKEKYKNEIIVLCGIEADYDSNIDLSSYDYIIGSVHYIFANGRYYGIDISHEKTIECINSGFSGDKMKFAAAYFKKVGNLVNKTGADIIGHFDLITIFEENGIDFDSENEIYKKSWMNSLDKLNGSVYYEINTGGMSRRKKQSPYPDMAIINELKSRNNKIVLSSDAHNTEDIAYSFEKIKKIL